MDLSMVNGVLLHDVIFKTMLSSLSTIKKIEKIKKAVPLIYGTVISNGNEFPSAIKDLPDIGSLKDIKDAYLFWTDMVQTAKANSEECTRWYNLKGEELISLEDEINTRYLKGDKLREQINTKLAAIRGLEVKIPNAEEALRRMQDDIYWISRKLQELEAKKRMYDAMRWIPVVGWITEIIAAIEGTRGELQSKKKSFENADKELQKLHMEIEKVKEEHDGLVKEMNQNEAAINQLNNERIEIHRQRDLTAKDMLMWKDREQYYLSLSKDIAYLVEIDADLEEFKKLISENPPPFKLAA